MAFFFGLKLIYKIKNKVLPRPAYVNDLKEAVAAGRISHLMLLLDGDIPQSIDFIESVEKEFGRANITAVCPLWTEEGLGLWLRKKANLEICPSEWNRAVGLAKMVRSDNGNPKSTFLFPSGWNGENGSPIDLSLVLLNSDRPDVIISERPYDTYNIRVKSYLEKAVLPLIKKWKCLYLHHEPQFGILRVYDAYLFEKRVKGRKKRMRIYHAIVSCFLFMTFFLSRISALKGWRNI